MIDEGFSMFNAELEHIQDFYKSGGIGYKKWLGRPEQNPNLTPVIKLLDIEFSYLEGSQYTILELGPQGGRWTNQLLSIMEGNGYPFALAYHVVGSIPETNLVARDVLAPQFNPSRSPPSIEATPSPSKNFIYGEKYRVRSGNQHILITEFEAKRFESSMLETHKLVTQYRLIFCMDNFQNLEEVVILEILEEVGLFLYPGSMFLFNMDSSGWDNICSTLPDLNYTVYFKHEWRGSTYVAIRKISFSLPIPSIPI